MTTNTNQHHSSRVAPFARVARSAAVLALAVAPTLAVSMSSAGASSATTVTIGESSNGHVVTVAKGQHLVVALHSTYWTITPLSRRTILAQLGTQKMIAPLPSPTHCVPGQGCGSVTMHYAATGAGVVRLSAQRTTCGEAMRCTGTQGSWSVTVRVH